VNALRVSYLDDRGKLLLEYLDDEGELEVVKHPHFHASTVLEGSPTPDHVVEDWSSWLPPSWPPTEETGYRSLRER
jgi:hypothetical protein